jgi:hypothetical protein
MKGESDAHPTIGQTSQKAPPPENPQM